ncbi:MAG TPA: EAL domain-containing protein [Gammaproteobacteria bacterium]|nr:EAL domain-containing protein [Gammaproteobacteria bacterium]HIK69721.1 EAL domain-containing protein [Pseudomonadales bacterium]
MLGPGSVVPIAEASGLIHVLTKEIFVTAVEQVAQWSAAGKNWKISCNFSIDDLASPDIVSFVEEMLASFKVSPEQIILEVTESKLAQDSSLILEQLTRIRLRGIGLSIDDFGTGFSSMEQLRKFPFTELKIDRAFVFGASSQPAAKAIFESSVELAHRMGMVAVAEGAETEEDLLLCRELKVDLIQGYLIARPMPAEQVVEWEMSRES